MKLTCPVPLTRRECEKEGPEIKSGDPSHRKLLSYGPPDTGTSMRLPGHRTHVDQDSLKLTEIRLPPVSPVLGLKVWAAMPGPNDSLRSSLNINPPAIP